MIRITWHLFLLVLLALFSFCYALTRVGDGMFGSVRSWALAAWAVVVTVVFLIYGGVFWW